MESSENALSSGRDAYGRRAWSDAYDGLHRAAQGGADLKPGDRQALAVAAFMTGHFREFCRALQEAYGAFEERGDSRRAARCAFWLGVHLGERGESAKAAGWIGRATRLLEREDRDCVERGFLLLPTAQRLAASGELEDAGRLAADVLGLAQRHHDRELTALALHLQGRVLVRQGRLDEGMTLLDEAMILVTTDELSPLASGLIYCSVIGACREVWALQRAEEWTEALTKWCDAHPDMVGFDGECRVFRAEILRRRGSWPDALEEARRAAERFVAGDQTKAAGQARYLEGEVYRLRGEYGAAEEAYRTASRAGHEPQPGLALLRMAQGDEESADAALRRALSETGDSLRRARLLPAFVEIAVATGALDDADEACRELSRTGDSYGGGLAILAQEARGATELARERADAALPHLRRAWRGWTEAGASYDAARVGVLLAQACLAVGDEDGAELEIDRARAEFQRLGATPDVRRLDALTGRRPIRDHGLTPREREVLALVATGRTNRAIADELFISDKTVARHVSNIFGKLGLSSRAAATAYAYEHDLIDPSA